MVKELLLIVKSLKLIFMYCTSVSVLSI